MSDSWDSPQSDPLADLQHIYDEMVKNIGLPPSPHLALDAVEADSVDQVVTLSHRNGWQVQCLTVAGYDVVWGITADKEVKVYWYGLMENG